MLTIGFVCGQQYTPRCKLTSVRNTHTRSSQSPSDGQHQDTILSEPVYADPQEKGLNMIDNVAYISTVTQTTYQSN